MFILFGAGCSSEVVIGQQVDGGSAEAILEEKDGFVSFVGTIVYLDHYGGVYAIRVQDKFYDPMQLPLIYRQPGMKVKVRARLRGHSSERSWGQLVHIVAIETLTKDADGQSEEGS